MQGPLNFASWTAAGSPPLTTANNPRVQDECPVTEGPLPAKRRRKVMGATVVPHQPRLPISLLNMDKHLELPGLQDGIDLFHSGNAETLSKPPVWSAGQQPFPTTRRTGVHS